MELRVNDYVRTDIGEIRKVVRVTDDLYVLDKDIVFAHKDKIKKSSPNIIDLIEVGDYVNGERVINIIKKHRYLEVSDEEITIDEEEIHSIVTKEQFEAIKYEIK